MCTGVFVFSLLFIGAVIGSDENQAKLRFYHSSLENYTELPLDETDQIFSSKWYDASKLTVVFCHGFTGHPGGPAVKAIVTTYLEQGKSNVALLNWDKLAGMELPGLLNSYMNWAIPNSVQLGTDFAETLLKLSAAGLDLNNTHFVGHSLGAHVLGMAGSKLAEKGVQLPWYRHEASEDQPRWLDDIVKAAGRCWMQVASNLSISKYLQIYGRGLYPTVDFLRLMNWITGLDPATGFDMKPAFLRLNPNSALLTVAVHSDPNKYGSKREIGLVNFWPNYRAFGPVLQPGCPGGSPTIFSDEDFCSHNRSWHLFVNALKHPGTILGSYAKSFRAWKKYNKEEREKIILELGVFEKNVVPGNYYFLTAEKEPFGLGKDGL